MKIHDISQEIFNCQIYPGDPIPEKKTLCSMENGDLYNLTAFSMCAHNGTHIDAPFHFIKDGKTVDSISLDALIGMAYVVEYHGIVSGEAAVEILEKAKNQNLQATKRILIKGDAEVSAEAAKVFAEDGILLLGNESQTVGPENAPMEVHLILLGANVVLLEGIRLSEVSEGVYFLNAAPLNLSGVDGSPCRAVRCWKIKCQYRVKRSQSKGLKLCSLKPLIYFVLSIDRSGHTQDCMTFSTNDFTVMMYSLF